MRIILRKSAHPQQPVHGARPFIPVHGTQFTQSHRQITIAVLAVGVNQNVTRTVHRLQLILGIIQLHRREHVFRIKISVAGSLPQIAPHHVRGIDQRVAALQIRVAHPVFQLFADDAALRMEKNQTRPGQFLNAEQIQFLPQFAVVAFLRFLQLVEVFVEVFLREPRSAVNALQLFVFLVAFPVSARDGKQLEGLNPGSVRQMRTAAEINKRRSQRVLGKDIARALFNQLDLHRLIHCTVFRQTLRLRNQLAVEGQRLRLQLPHLLFDAFEVIRSEGNGPVEIVIETVVDGGADPQLGFGEKFQHRGRAKMSSRVTINLQRLDVFRRKNLKG